MSVNLGFGNDDEKVDLFGGINAAEIADDPYDVPDDSYEVTCSDSAIARTKNAQKLGLTLTWTITDASNASIIGRKVLEWFAVGPFENTPGTQEYDQEVARRSWLKRRLTSMGVPESKMGSTFDPSDLIGTEGVIKTKKKTNPKNDQTNVTVQSFKLTDTNGAGSSSVFG